ncbi:hypothetical protein N7455_011386 [Penicillium solitum]|uniref:uncharacterized protein n=1 Tax=Penicillium solitum TaxID=60172 RepID=UPI0032C410C6|nr:hypothetical protein N7455_011386 [Penicillium solitum]
MVRYIHYTLPIYLQVLHASPAPFIIQGNILVLMPVFHISEHKSHMSLIIQIFLTPSPTIEQKESQESKKIDRRRDRTCNLLIRSQAPCHWASRPVQDLVQF